MEIDAVLKYYFVTINMFANYNLKGDILKFCVCFFSFFFQIILKIINFYDSNTIFTIFEYFFKTCDCKKDMPLMCRLKKIKYVGSYLQK